MLTLLAEFLTCLTDASRNKICEVCFLDTILAGLIETEMNKNLNLPNHFWQRTLNTGFN